MERLYANIGGKIKKWAIWIFIVEAILSVLSGFFMIVSSADESLDGVGGSLLLVGLLMMVFGPVVAWVSSWILYAFGELVEKTCENEANTRAILQILMKGENNPYTAEKPEVKKPLQETHKVSAEPKSAEKGYNSNKTVTPTLTMKNEILCPLCGYKQPGKRTVCWHCGAHLAETDSTHKWVCGNCGKLRMQTPCEHCAEE